MTARNLFPAIFIVFACIGFATMSSFAQHTPNMPTSKILNLTYVFPEGLYAEPMTLNKVQDDLGPRFAGDTADVVTVELHNSPYYPLTEFSTVGALKTDGSVSVTIPAEKDGSYFITVKHRNCVETTTALPVSFSGSGISYMFDMPSKAFAGNMILLTNGIAGIYTGDVNQDGIVDGTDLSDVENLAAIASTGYLPQDITGDGLVDASDLSNTANNAALAIVSITSNCSSYSTVSVLITSPANQGCAGTDVTFTATPSNGGTAPSYQWRVNGNNVGISSPAYTYPPVTGDLVSCILTSNEECITGYTATSNEISMIVSPFPAAPVAGIHVPSVTQITWNWNAVPEATGYKWNTTNNYTTAMDMGTSMTKLETGLTCNTNYTRYVWAYKACGNSTMTTLTQTSSSNPPSAPAAGTHVPSQTQIVWKWNTVSGATGYKWGTTNNYANATDMGTAITKTETGLTCNTSYSRYVWSYNTCGTSTATSLTLSTGICCPSPITDSRDGKSYTTVLIGNQCWMSQNLNIGTKVLGANNQTNNSVIEKYCNMDLESNCNIYGGLYQWNEAMQYSTTQGAKGICPTGWHLPTDAEWTTLTTYLGGISIAGGKMKEAGTTHWSAPNTGATNSSGFTALPGGNRDFYTDFYPPTYDAAIWASTQKDATNAWYRYLEFMNESVYQLSPLSKTYGLSVRCMKD